MLYMSAYIYVWARDALGTGCREREAQLNPDDGGQVGLGQEGQ